MNGAGAKMEGRTICEVLRITQRIPERMLNRQPQKSSLLVRILWYRSKRDQHDRLMFENIMVPTVEYKIISSFG